MAAEQECTDWFRTEGIVGAVTVARKVTQQHVIAILPA